MEFCKAFHSGSLLVLPTNIRLGWKSMQVANTLDYYDTAIISAVKSFIVQAPGGQLEGGLGVPMHGMIRM